MCVRARGRAAVTGAGGEPAAEGSEAADLHAIGASNNCKDGKATVDPDEPSALVLRSMLMAPAGMEGRSFDVQAHIPSVNAPDDRRGQDSGARCCYGLTRMWVEVLDGSEHPRNRLVSSCTRMVPIFGRITDLGCPSPTRIPSRPLGSFLFRRRTLSRCRPLRLCRGKPTWPFISAYRASANRSVVCRMRFQRLSRRPALCEHVFAPHMKDSEERSASWM
jgi:hypothetical protein